MSKNEKYVNGVFTEMVGTDETISTYDVFINRGPKEPSQDLDKYTNMYKGAILKFKTNFEKMALLEEIIMQIRSKENITDIKLSIVRNDYIYARAPFYRRGGTTKDIRVIVGKIEFDGSDLNRLAKDLNFMDKCKRKLSVVMDKVITDNKNIFQDITK